MQILLLEPAVALGQQVTGGEDKPGEIPQTARVESVSPWIPGVPHCLLREGLCGHKPQASGHSHPCSHTMAPLSQAPCAGRDGTQTQPISFCSSFSLRFYIYSFFNL